MRFKPGLGREKKALLLIQKNFGREVGGGFEGGKKRGEKRRLHRRKGEGGVSM